MAKRSAPSGLSNDPALVERRGDLSGFSALAFLIILLAGAGAMAFLLLAPLKPAGVATASASPTARPTPPPSASPGPGLSPSVAPSQLVIEPVEVAQDEAASLIQDGSRVGTVTVTSAQFVRGVIGQRPPSGKRWLVASVTYHATASLDYAAADWFAVDKDGARFGWLGSGDPPPALASGTLDSGAEVTGNVTFEVPSGRAIPQLVLTDGAGNDLVVVTLG